MKSLIKKWILATSSAAVACVLVPSAASALTVSLFDGYYGSGAYYSPFFTAQSFTVRNIASTFGSSDLAGSQLVVLSALDSVSATQIAALSSYVNGGGRLFVAADGAGFESYQASLNAVSAGIGSSIANINGSFDAGVQSTNSIATAPFTAGISKVKYAYTSSLTGGTNLINGSSGQSVVRYEQVGSGYFFAASDLNLSNFLTDSAADNGRLLLNFATASSSAVPEPASWALMIVGFAAVGGVMRARQRIKMTVAYS